MNDYYQMRYIDQIKLEHLDYMSLLYDKISGITHILAEPMPQIIEALGHKSLLSAQVAQYLQKNYDINSEPESENIESLEDIISARLDELVEMGLAVKIAKEAVHNNASHVTRFDVVLFEKSPFDKIPFDKIMSKAEVNKEAVSFSPDANDAPNKDTES